MKKKVIIFGSTDTGQAVYQDIKNDAEVLFYVDEDTKKQGCLVDGIMVRGPEALLQAEFDLIYIGVLTYFREAVALLDRMGVPKEKIVSRYVEIPTYARMECLKSIRRLFDEEGINGGAVAELGVYQGEFAKEINRIFPDRACYLFDTFEGFPGQDCEIEMQRGYMGKNRSGYFSNTSEQAVLGKMEYPGMCRICRGVFPQSAAHIDDEFCFVNLDADLYAPTLAGMEFFYPRMVAGGILLIHDYFSKAFLGAKEAVREFCRENQVTYVPIGDTLSVAVRKQG